MYVVPPLSPSTHFHYLLCTRRLLTQLHPTFCPIKNLFCKILNCDCRFSPCHLICVGGSDGRTLTGLQESGNCTPTIKGYICGAENISKFHAICIWANFHPISGKAGRKSIYWGRMQNLCDGAGGHASFLAIEKATLRGKSHYIKI